MAKKTILMETTDVPADRSASEITAALVKAGASSVSLRYDAGRIVGLSWTMRVAKVELPLAMPARVDPVYQILKSRQSGILDATATARMKAKAERIAWRQLLRWAQAQLAMIEIGMVEKVEVFMPYIERDGRSFYEHFKSQQLSLPAPEPQR